METLTRLRETEGFQENQAINKFTASSTIRNKPAINRSMCVTVDG
jgi:hypothetical protein